MAEEKEKVQPVSMWTDAKLRPWTKNEPLDEKINDANILLDDMMQKTSGSRNAGCRGANPDIDVKPDAFLDFERMIADPNWMAKLGTDEGDAEAERILRELEALIQIQENMDHQNKAAQNKAQNKGPETDSASSLAIAGKMDEDKLLMSSILDFNASLYETNGVQPDTEIGSHQNRRGLDPNHNHHDDEIGKPSSATMKLIEKVRLARKPRKKHINPAYSLKAISYKKTKKVNPKVLNVSTAEFQSLMERFNLAKAQRAVRMGGNLTVGADGRSTFTSTATLPSTMMGGSMGATADSLLSGAGGSGSGLTSPIGIGAVGELKNDELLEGMDKNALIELLLKERASSREGGGVTTGGRRRGLELDQTENKNQSKLVLSSIGEEGVGAGQEQGGDLLLSSSRPNSQGLLAPLQSLTSPIKSGRVQGSRPGSATIGDMSSASVDFGKSTTIGGFNNNSNSNNASRKMSKSMSVPSLGSASRARDTGKSNALDKLSLSGTMNNTHSLSKARLQEVRQLRDHLMTTSGSFTMNVNPDSSPDAQQEVAESIAVTKEMVKETMRKNRVDQTWTLISTPGFYEAVGPAEIFKSDIHKNFVRNEVFDKATRDADVTKGIKRDALRVWSEDGVKSNIKIFQSGGALKI